MSEEMSIAAQVEALGRQFASLARDANLEDVRRYVESFESKVRGLPAKIEEVRARGYPYRSFLENKARIFETQWQETAARVWTQVEEESRALRAVLADVESRVTALRAEADPGKQAAGGIDAGAGAAKSRLGDASKPSLSSALQKSSPAPPEKSLQGRPAKTLGDAPGALSGRTEAKSGATLGGAEGGAVRAGVDGVQTSLGGAGAAPKAQADEVAALLAQVEARVKAASSTARSMFDTLARNLDQTARMIDEINWTLNQAEEASFAFQPNESPVIAAEAQWHVQGGDSPEGVLYLTDQRLIFEQKEKKGGFLGMGGKKVQDIAWEVPVGYIENAKSYDEGFFGRKDMIDLALSASAPYGQLVVEVKKGDNDWWLRQINRARTGGLENERVGGKAAGVDEVALSEAPTNCPNCGGVLPEIVKGMAQLRCEYCNTVIRL